jgi:uridine kinase
LERGRSVDSVLKQYIKFVRPGFQSFVLPTMQYADLIIPRAKENTTAIGVLARECARKVVQRQRLQTGTGQGIEDMESRANSPIPVTPKHGDRPEDARAPTPFPSAAMIDTRQA